MGPSRYRFRRRSFFVDGFSGAQGLPSGLSWRSNAS